MFLKNLPKLKDIILQTERVCQVPNTVEEILEYLWEM